VKQKCFRALSEVVYLARLPGESVDDFVVRAKELLDLLLKDFPEKIAKYIRSWYSKPDRISTPL